MISALGLATNRCGNCKGSGKSEDNLEELHLDEFGCTGERMFVESGLLIRYVRKWFLKMKVYR